MSVYAKLQKAQLELNAPKNQWNSHGNYAYRSCEDVVEGAKKVCKDNELLLLVSDEMVVLGDRFYIKATAKVIDLESNESVESNGFAREALTQKGMQDAQLSGATSSYARKYALNGLFAIDDSKDPDTPEFKKQEGAQEWCKESVINFGKHKGKTIATIWSEDRQYLNYLLDSTQDKTLKAYLESILIK